MALAAALAALATAGCSSDPGVTVDAAVDRPLDQTGSPDVRPSPDAPLDTGPIDGPADAAPDVPVGSDAGDGPADARIFPDVIPATFVLSPEAFDFQTVSLGASATHSFQLENTGQLGSGTPSVVVTGASAEDTFRILDNQCETSLEPGTTCTIEVQFSPAAAGPASALLEVQASPGGRVSSQLTGTGAGP